MRIFGLSLAFFDLAFAKRFRRPPEHEDLSTVEHMHYELEDYDPNPNPDSVVWSIDGRARFTVLTDHLVRIEIDAFDNRPSLAVVHRNLVKPEYKVERHAEGTVIRTKKIELYYKENAELIIQAVNAETGHSWKYGDYPTGNLFGTIRTLDTLGPTNLNCTTFIDPDAHCEYGLVSMDGWAVVNDTGTPRLGGEDDWWNGTSSATLDMYLFMHGRDFKGAVSDYAKIGGRVPLPPRYMFGVLWTRWFNYDSTDLKQLVSGFSVRGLPLDMLVIDMNWHIKPWWGSYTWDKRIIPDPVGLAGWIHERGVSIGLNIHDCLLAEHGCPAGTLSADESEFFSAYLAATGHEISENLKSIPLDLVNKTSAFAKEDIVVKSFEGVADMWWVDWQQGDSGPGGLRGGKENPTIWLNKLRYTNRKRWGSRERGSVLSRYGGLGSQRYGTGFSGDVQMLDWENLSYQPFFTATAANVLFSSWSHDVTGPNRDPELFVRWTQWAAMSGVLRFHERGMSSGPCAFSTFPGASKECANVDLWANLGHRFSTAIRETTLLRERMLPYIYTAAFETFQNGVPWIRPLYYDFPEEEMSFKRKSQYMFGDLITVAPVVLQSDPWAPTSTEWTIWVPPGDWYSPNDGALIAGNTTYTRYWDLMEIPYLVKAGSLLPQRYVDPSRGSQQLVGLAMTNFTDIVFEVIPGGSSGEAKIYEDDGKTTDYISGTHGWIRAKYIRDDDRITVRVSVEGEYSHGIMNRRIHIRILDTTPIAEVRASTKSSPHSRYLGTTMSAETFVDWDIRTDGTEIEIEIQLQTLPSRIDLSGVKGAIAHARYAKAALDEAVLTPGTHPCWHGAPCGYRSEEENLIRAASTGERLEREKDMHAFERMILEFVEFYKNSIKNEVTVDTILRVDTNWAPTQGGWPEATRLRVNYAVETINAALHGLCEKNGLKMPLVCPPVQEDRIHTDQEKHSTYQDHVLIIVDA